MALHCCQISRSRTHYAALLLRAARRNFSLIFDLDVQAPDRNRHQKRSDRPPAKSGQ
jgi:hypothetical protein